MYSLDPRENSTVTSLTTFPTFTMSHEQRSRWSYGGNRVTVSTSNKNNSVPTGHKQCNPLNNGEDIFSNEPREVYFSANYTSVFAFSYSIPHYLTSVISKSTKCWRRWELTKGTAVPTIFYDRFHYWYLVLCYLLSNNGRRREGKVER